jgi:hypothetical protein
MPLDCGEHKQAVKVRQMNPDTQDTIERLTALGLGHIPVARLTLELIAEIERLRERNREHEARYDALEAMTDYYKQDAASRRCVLCGSETTGISDERH